MLSLSLSVSLSLCLTVSLSLSRLTANIHGVGVRALPPSLSLESLLGSGMHWEPDTFSITSHLAAIMLRFKVGEWGAL